MIKREILSVIEPIIEAFKKLGVAYYISGSVASSAYGTARSTLDVDLVSNLSEIHVDPLILLLKNDYYIDRNMIMDAIGTETSFNLLHFETMMKIDVFLLQKKSFDSSAFERRKEDTIESENESLKIYLCSPEDIILNKLTWFKKGGEISERQWMDIIGVIKIQGDHLDKNYLLKWAEHLNIKNLLEQSFEECGITLS